MSDDLYERAERRVRAMQAARTVAATIASPEERANAIAERQGSAVVSESRRLRHQLAEVTNHLAGIIEEWDACEFDGPCDDCRTAVAESRRLLSGATDG